ncbi:glycosyltransferase [Elioraea thermophila]|uniref:glycosyltransferase n=1 Tax=Elioraea thermophila TaxID=2185104 RepID=UPI001300AA54|nr:glycosyltransferase [Elioraea thermophila]
MSARASRADGGFSLSNSDVVPDRPGWVGRLVSDLSVNGTVAVGPKLLFEDGSIQHAGLYFTRDADGLRYNRQYFKGLPRADPPAGKAREVPAVTGACLHVDRAAFEAVGGLTEASIVGDCEDSELCLTLRARGGRIRYEPAVEVRHFERRSIALSRSYRGTLASLLNRRLHAER